MGEHVAPTTPAKKKRSNIFWNIVGVVGELLITFAIIVGLFSVSALNERKNPAAPSDLSTLVRTRQEQVKAL